MVLKVDATLHRLRPCLGFELNMICHTLRPCESGPYTRQMKRGIFNNESIGCQSKIRIRLVVVFTPLLKKDTKVIKKVARLYNVSTMDRVVREARPRHVVELR